MLGCGGMGLLGLALGIVVLGALFAAGLRSCDLDLDVDPDPGKGDRSAHLAVAVSKTVGLHDGDPVRVTSTAFEPNHAVGIALCLREADTERRGVDACDTAGGVRWATSPRGRLDATYVVRRVITVGGVTFDCATAPRRCLLVAASTADFDRSGGQPLTFADDPRPPDLAPRPERPKSDHLPVVGRPVGRVSAGTRVTVVASGFHPGEPLLVAHCTDRFDQAGPAACEPLDLSAAVMALGFGRLPDRTRADEKGQVRVTVRAVGRVEAVGDPLGTGPPAHTTPCTDRPGRCSIVVAAAADTRRSAVLPYDVTAG